MESLLGIEINSNYLELGQEIGTILFAEFPTTTMFLNNKGELIVREWVDCSDDNLIDRYFYFKTDKLNIARLFESKISYIDFIRNSIDGFVYFQDVESNIKSNITLLSVRDIPISYLPSSGFKPEKCDIVDYERIKEILELDKINLNVDISKKAKEFAVFHKNDIYNLHIKKGNGVGFGIIKTETLGRTLIKFQNLYESIALDTLLGKNRGIIDLKKEKNKKIASHASSEVVVSMAASYSLLLRPTYSDFEIFDSRSSGEIIASKTFSLLNNSIDIVSLKSEYHKHSGFTIAAFKSFLKEIYSLELDLNISWFSHQKDKDFTQNINFVLASNIIYSIESLSTTNEEKFNKKGKFRAINCDTGHFTFFSLEEEQFTGYFDKKIREISEQIIFTKIYEISIQRKIIEDAVKEMPQYKDTILDFF